ncbi:ATP-dependent DNA helicase [Paucibacter sp. Y2R2-4]|uniref:ATP-dependent DNA helicase n=1 Tax=Paucibacter sp. Y2R2-4 TaxID=2893553 RepID=UPI0021E45019|nr:ATP-dependent DNA helicase [Paucibacter sp. Y2R2-4]MCV2352418.1 ATP-dependent DNA helicase [Paucibacter sp. Y2R2-4]
MNAKPQYTVAVRALCEFAAKSGDLDLRFTPAPSSQEGIAGHALVASRRGADYRAELSLSGQYQGLLVRGRADGYDPGRKRLEEVKTHRVALARMPANHRALHWAQLKVYGALLCASEGLTELDLALVYFDVVSEQETVLCERHSAAELQMFFEQLCERFQGWAERELDHRAARDQALNTLRFPHADFRQGQRPLAESVYKAAVSGRCLLAQAPTGIGKTVGTIFPLLKASPGQRLDKVFFLAAKTSGRAMALEALNKISRAAPEAPPLRVLELVARDKACEHPDKACHGESCPLAQGFYERLPAARLAAVSQPSGTLLDKAALRALALQHQVCPYYLSQELVRWADVVVGDYNYFFDLSAMLHGMSQEAGWRVALLVDEAHNLVERGRKMYSAELQQAKLRALKLDAPAVLKKPLDKLQRTWAALNKEAGEAQREYAVLEALPAKLLTALQLASAAITEYMSEHPTERDVALQDFYFEALHFTRLAELFGPHSLCDWQLSSQGLAKTSSTLCIRNVLPAEFLKPRLQAAHTAVLFSATLQPFAYFADLLGLPERSAWLEVEAPFSAEQLQVRVAQQVSTRYQHRRASLPALVALMGQQFQQAPGNYLAFFSSHDYLNEAADLFEREFPAITIWRQQRRMAESAQAEFLARLTESSQGIGFVVLGGSFSEGVDLPGKRLIGAFIATLGLPQLNPVNEQIRMRLDQLLGQGYDYAYLYPGLQKVVQAAGRVIRTVSDAGVVVLMDDRYAQPEIQALLPRWWRIERPS